MKHFLQDIADNILQKDPNSLEKMVIVLPSKRSMTFLKHYLSQLIDKPIFLPDMYTIEQFIEFISGYHILDNISLNFYLYEAYNLSVKEDVETFDAFINWSDVLLNDFNEVDKNLVKPNQIFTNLRDVRDIENWSFNEKKLSPLQMKYSLFYDKLHVIYLHMNKILQQKSCAYQGMAYRKASENINSIQLPWEKVWFVGLNALNKCEEKIIGHLKSIDVARVFWDADNYYYKNKHHEAGDFLRNQKEIWSDVKFKGLGDYLKFEKEEFNVIGCPKNVAQAKVCSNILNNLNVNELEKSNTAVVLPDERLLYPVLNSFPEKVCNINITMGSPIKYTPIYIFINSLFELQLNSKSGNYDYKDVFAVINHSIFSQFIDEITISELRSDIIRQNQIVISSNYLISKLDKKNTICDVIFSLWHNVDDALSKLNTIIEALRVNLIGRKASVNSEIINEYSKVFLLLCNIINDSNSSFELKTLYKIISQLISREMIQFEGEPLKGVQLMGILETRTLDFDNLIVLSANEGVLPKSKSLNSFIPYDLKRFYGMTLQKDRDSIYSYHFYRLLQRAKKVNILYNTEVDDFGSGEKSRFLVQLQSEYPHTINQYTYSEKINSHTYSPMKVPNVNLESLIRAWARNISPTSINLYLNCKLSFYYNYLIKVRTRKGIKEYIESDIIGSAIHEAFADSYPLGVLSVNKIKQKEIELQNSLERHFVEMSELSLPIEGKNYLSLSIAKRLSANFMNYEKDILHPSKSNYIKILEKEIELKHSLVVDGEEFTICGKIDRVDICNDELRIIDYKSGVVKDQDLTFYDWSDLCKSNNHSKVLQLLLYAYIYLMNNPQYLDMKVVAGNFSLKNMTNGMIFIRRSINRKKHKLYIDRKVLDEIEQIIIRIVRLIKEEDFIANSDDHYCDFCT